MTTAVVAKVDLSKRERMFIDSYFEHHDAYRAAKDAGYGENIARRAEYWITDPKSKPNIHSAVMRRLQLRRNIAPMVADEVFFYNRDLMNLDIPKILQAVNDGTINNHEYDSVRKYIQNITTNKDGSTSVFIADKMKAIDNLQKVLGMNKEKLDTNVNVKVEFFDITAEKIRDAQTVLYEEVNES